MDSLNVMTLLAICLAVAFIAQKITERLKLPTVTGYIIMGVLLGGSLVGVLNYLFHWHLPPLFSTERLRDFGLAGDIALTLVAFAVGAELDVANLRKVGRSILYIAVLESLGAFVLVAGAVWLINGDKAMALILGAVASATAPAATVMVIRQYRARGPLTTTILAVVGMDDAVALMIYSFAATVAGGILAHDPSLSLAKTVGMPVLEIIGALVLGGTLGLVGSVLLKNVRGTDHLLAGGGAMLLLAGGLAKAWGLSPLLTSMALGMMIVNRNAFVKNRLSSVFSGLAPLFYALFFILGGAR
ncbi:MAG: cation:proton antiporter, partial [Planctomycetes bacterium]|nr:cation:proton antiporter [Planctomycetota bacterium]